MDWPINIQNYKPFYIQTESDTEAWSTEVFGLVAKSNPYPIMPIPKAPYNVDRKDENGSDEFVGVQFFAAQELSVKFYCKIPAGDDSEKMLRLEISRFFEKVKSKEFSIYDCYTGIGRQCVRYAGYDEDSFVRGDGFARAIFTVKFKVNDPLTPMYYDEETGQITSTAPEDSGSAEVWLPFIWNYKPFLIQAPGDATAWSTEVYGLIAKSNPYPAMPSPKDPYKNDRKDGNGDDEYVDELYYNSQELGVKLYCKVPAGDESEKILREQIREFFDKIKYGEFYIYDDYTGIGRRKVHYAGYEEDSFLSRDGFARAIFTLKLKVNDPTTLMYYNEETGQITDDPIPGRDDLLGAEDGDYIITEDGLYIKVA